MKYRTIVADPPWPIKPLPAPARVSEGYSGKGPRRAAYLGRGRTARGFSGRAATANSRKPEAFLDMVEQVSPGPYLEMFSRRARLGWDTWGDEALHGTELTA